jgi:hypothetical protein
LRQEQRRRAQAQHESGTWLKPWLTEQQLILHEQHAFRDKLQRALAKLRRLLRSQGIQPPFSAKAIRAPASNTAVQPPDSDTWPQLYQLSNLFAVQNIRRGAMGQQCSVDLAYYHQQTDELLHDILCGWSSAGRSLSPRQER